MLPGMVAGQHEYVERRTSPDDVAQPDEKAIEEQHDQHLLTFRGLPVDS